MAVQPPSNTGKIFCPTCPRVYPDIPPIYPQNEQEAFPIGNTPPEVFSRIFSFLVPKDLWNSAQVCKRFDALITDDPVSRKAKWTKVEFLDIVNIVA